MSEEKEEKKTFTEKYKQVGALLLAGAIGTGSGGAGSAYWFGSIDKDIDNIKNEKVDKREFQKFESLVISVAVDVCKIRSADDPAGESNCERIRHDYYNAKR